MIKVHFEKGGEKPTEIQKIYGKNVKFKRTAGEVVNLRKLSRESVELRKWQKSFWNWNYLFLNISQ